MQMIETQLSLVLTTETLASAILEGKDDSGTRLLVFHARDVPHDFARAYAVMAAFVQAHYPANLRAFRFDDILSGDNLLAFVVQNGVLQAAAYASRVDDDGVSILAFKGFVAHSHIKGLGTLLIAGLVSAETYWSGNVPHGRAIARIMPDGSINEASTTPFGDMGFHGARNTLDRIDSRDIQLELAAIRKPDGLYVASHVMTGNAARLGKHASERLHGWSMHFRRKAG
jgi:hypothetical protein